MLAELGSSERGACILLTVGDVGITPVESGVWAGNRGGEFRE